MSKNINFNVIMNYPEDVKELEKRKAKAVARTLFDILSLKEIEEIIELYNMEKGERKIKKR